VIKRPVVVHTDAAGAVQVTVGFSPQAWAGWLSS
jgi:arsenate reductase-like glutaredoxin family protein